MDPVHVLTAAGGAMRWRDLMIAGVTRDQLARARQAGAVVRRLYGTYSLPHTQMPVWMAAAYRAHLSCVSLCEEFKLPLLAHPKSIHLVVPASRALRADDRRPRDRIVLHRSDVAWEQSPLHPIATAIDIAGGCLGLHGQVALVDAALNRRLIGPGDLRTFTHTTGADLALLIDHTDSAAQSIMESYARARLTGAGFAVRSQVVVGPRGHRDLVVEGVVVVELDGWETHSTPEAFQEDRARDRAAVIAGKVPLRYTYADLFGPYPADIVGDVEAAIRLIRRAA